MIVPRKTLRRGEPTKQEKQEARIKCCERAMEACEECGRWLPLEVGQLHHLHSKRRFGWMESEDQKHAWLCHNCHLSIHIGGKPCPKK